MEAQRDRALGGTAGARGALRARAVAWGLLWGPTYRVLLALFSLAVLVDDVLLVADDRGADPGHVQWTFPGPLPQQPWDPEAGHH